MLGILGAFLTTIYKGNGTECLLTKQALFVYHYFTTPGILAGGTNKGKVAMWKHVVTKPQQRKLEGQEKWELQSPAVLEGVTQLSQIQVRK